MTDLTTTARAAAIRLRATADGTDHVDEEEALRDLAQLLDRLAEDRDAEQAPALVDYQAEARAFVRAYAREHLDKSDPGVEFDVYVVWFAKTLQNWKALVSTSLPDGRYYEVTHNGDRHETYLDAYVKLDNQRIPEQAGR